METTYKPTIKPGVYAVSGEFNGKYFFATFRSTKEMDAGAFAFSVVWENGLSELSENEAELSTWKINSVSLLREKRSTIENIALLGLFAFGLSFVGSFIIDLAGYIVELFK